MKIQVKIIAAALLALFLTVALTSCSLEDKGYYDMGADRITSVKGVIGEMGNRKMNSINVSTTDGVQTNIYEYKTDPSDKTQAANDMAAYFQRLLDTDGFITLISFDGMPYEGGIDMQFAKDSVDAGKIIILDIDYNSTGYTLTFTKCEGTLSELYE